MFVCLNVSSIASVEDALEIGRYVSHPGLGLRLPLKIVNNGEVVKQSAV